MSSSESQRKVWDRVFRRETEAETYGPTDDLWLSRWTEILEETRRVPVLELGCGAGRDTRYLTECGFEVLATDFSEEALKLTLQNAPGARVRELDLTEAFPFASSSFSVVVASLSLHYFPWRETIEVAGEIRRVLVPGGLLLARFNSTADEFHDLSRGEEIEANFHLVRGLPRRLFDRRSIEALFAEGWELESAEERATGRFGRTKTLWEVAARKPEG